MRASVNAIAIPNSVVDYPVPVCGVCEADCGTMYEYKGSGMPLGCEGCVDVYSSDEELLADVRCECGEYRADEAVPLYFGHGGDTLLGCECCVTEREVYE